MIAKGEWHLIRAMRNGGVSISDIARQMGLDRKTVRKALGTDCWPDDTQRPRVVRPSKLDPPWRITSGPGLREHRLYRRCGYTRR